MSSSPVRDGTSRCGTASAGCASRQHATGAWRMLPNVSRSSRSAVEHVPVLAAEVAELLDLQRGDSVVDATFGAGGHAAMLEPALGREGSYTGIDRDPS